MMVSGQTHVNNGSCTQSEGAAWAARVAVLARLTLAHLIVRADRYGKYGPDGRTWM